MRDSSGLLAISPEGLDLHTTKKEITFVERELDLTEELTAMLIHLKTGHYLDHLRLEESLIVPAENLLVFGAIHPSITTDTSQGSLKSLQKGNAFFLASNQTKDILLARVQRMALIAYVAGAILIGLAVFILVLDR